MNVEINSNLDQVILVDATDRQVGVMDKVEAHRHPAQLHRASSIFLFRQTQGNLELLIQQRSRFKIVGAHQWANTVCVNLRPGETYETAAWRRLEEELGIRGVELTEIYDFTYQVKCNQEFGENEVDHVFVGWYEGEVVSNAQEVQATQWVDFVRLKNDQGRSLSLDLAPWFKLMLGNDNLQNKIKSWLKNNFNEN